MTRKNLYKDFYAKYIEDYKINGKEMICSCPLHQDGKTPSMHIDLEQGGFHCFGCGAHGNARQFLQQLKAVNSNVDFIGEQYPDVVINTMFDTVLYASKPQGGEIGGIKNRIETQLQMQDYNLQDFISNFAEGKTIIPSGIKGDAEKNWKGQQVFLLDFDNKDLNNYTTVEQILAYCNQIGMTPTCIYHTFSSTKEVNKFRLVYVFKEAVTDYITAQVIVTALFDKFKQFKPDTSKQNLSDMFFGGKSIAFSSNIVYTAKVTKTKDITDADFKSVPSEKLDHTEIAEIIMNENELKLFNNSIYIYNNGVYSNSKQLLERKILEICNKAKKNTREEVTEYLKIKLENEELEVNKYFINFQNGLYCIEQKKIIPHTPEVFTINQIPLSYKADAPINEAVENFLTSITSKNCNRREAILQCIGYCMTASTDTQKSFIFYGATASNGKSTLLEVINKLIGKDNICHVSIHNMQDKFYVHELESKLVNTVSELANLTVKNTEVFKAIVTGDEISTEKKFKDRNTNAKIYAKSIFTTNVLPKVVNAGNDFYRRLCIILFEAQFTEEQKSKFKIEDLLTTEALEYLAHIAVEAYHRLLKSRKFATDEESNNVLGIYKEKNNSAISFLNNRENWEGKMINKEIAKTLLLNIYRRWCNLTKEEFIGRNKFYEAVLASNLFEKISKADADYFKLKE